MIWIRVFIISSMLLLLEAHKHCIQQIRWENLLKSTLSMSNTMSKTCAHHYNKDSLCDPAHMLNQVELNAANLVDIMKRAESVYRKHSNPQLFIEALQHTQHVLKPCTHHHHDHKPVETCFNKLEAFIQDKMSHVDCAWEIVTVTMREILQRLERRTQQRKR